MTIGTNSQRKDGRRAGLRRMWRILVLLRAKPHSLAQLAAALSASERTIRRDLEALQGIPLPIESRHPTRQGVRACEPNEWFVKAMPEWPDGDRVPLADVVDAKEALPPFPQGPLLPPGVRL